MTALHPSCSRLRWAGWACGSCTRVTSEARGLRTGMCSALLGSLWQRAVSIAFNSFAETRKFSGGVLNPVHPSVCCRWHQQMQCGCC